MGRADELQPRQCLAWSRVCVLLPKDAGGRRRAAAQADDADFYLPLRGIHLYEYRWLMIFDAARSLLCSVAMVLTCWLFLPILVLLPLALFFGFRFYRKVVARFRGSRILARVAGTVPMALALATLWMITELLSEGYRA